MNDVGESVASIRRRQDVQAWPFVKSALEAGAELYRPMGLRDYFTRGLDPKDQRNGRGVTAALVKRLEADGTLARVGVDTYKLAAAQDARQ